MENLAKRGGFSDVCRSLDFLRNLKLQASNRIPFAVRFILKGKCLTKLPMMKCLLAKLCGEHCFKQRSSKTQEGWEVEPRAQHKAYSLNLVARYGPFLGKSVCSNQAQTIPDYLDLLRISRSLVAAIVSFSHIESCCSPSSLTDGKSEKNCLKIRLRLVLPWLLLGHDARPRKSQDVSTTWSKHKIR